MKWFSITDVGNRVSCILYSIVTFRTTGPSRKLCLSRNSMHFCGVWSESKIKQPQRLSPAYCTAARQRYSLYRDYYSAVSVGGIHRCHDQYHRELPRCATVTAARSYGCGTAPPVLPQPQAQNLVTASVRPYCDRKSGLHGSDDIADGHMVGRE